MAEYKIATKTNKEALELFGLNKAVYKVYQKGIGVLDETGLKIPFQAGVEYGLQQIYKPGLNKLTADDILARSTQKEIAQSYPTSALGSPVFSQLKFSETFDNSERKGNKFEERNFIEHQYPIDTCLFTVSQEKIINKQSIQGRNGTVKEYIADGDFQIKIQGVINGRNGQYPMNEVENLIQFLKQPKALKIEIPYLNEIFSIDKIVIEGYDFPQYEGSISQQQFSINAVSDVDISIYQYDFGKGNMIIQAF